MFLILQKMETNILNKPSSIRIKTSVIIMQVLVFFCQNQWLKSECFLVFAAAAESPVPVKVGVVLAKESMEGKLRLSCIKMAISDLYAANPQFNTRIVIQVRNSKNHDIVMAAGAGMYLHSLIVKYEKILVNNGYL